VTGVGLALLAFGLCDVVAGQSRDASWRRRATAVVVPLAALVVLAWLGGWHIHQMVIAAAGAAAVLGVWVAAAASPSQVARTISLAVIAATFVVLVGVSGSVPSLGAEVERWYAQLGVSFVRAVPIEQFLVVIGGLIFLLATANRLVRLVLEAAGTPVAKGEATLRGGRVLGPMERLLVAGLVLAHDPAGIGFVVAAKGILRLPEIRDEQSASADDQVTEYFLIGTLASLLLAAAIALLAIAAG
jgi:hypothetical protein